MNGREHGSISLLVVFAAIALLLVVALVVDGGRKVQAVADATSLAQEAARAGGQALDRLALAQGQAATVEPEQASSEAAAYLAAAARNGITVVASDITATDTTITVAVVVTRPTVFLSAAGITTVSGSGTGQAELITAGAAP